MLRPIEIKMPRLWGRVTAITLWLFVFYRADRADDPALRAHEHHHWYTARRCGVVPWYLAYVLLLPFYGGERNHPLERAAYAEGDRVREENEL